MDDSWRPILAPAIAVFLVMLVKTLLTARRRKRENAGAAGRQGISGHPQ